jgi:hypothetical protein
MHYEIAHASRYLLMLISPALILIRCQTVTNVCPQDGEERFDELFQVYYFYLDR